MAKQEGGTVRWGCEGGRSVSSTVQGFNKHQCMCASSSHMVTNSYGLTLRISAKICLKIEIIGQAFHPQIGYCIFNWDQFHRHSFIACVTVALVEAARGSETFLQ